MVDDEVFRMTLKRDHESDQKKILPEPDGIQPVLSEAGEMWKGYESAKVPPTSGSFSHPLPR
jgi:hypothetical protein